LREDIARKSGARFTPAFAATTCAHSIRAPFLANRRCAFLSPSRQALRILRTTGFMPAYGW
jgi:hypothetical protein